jgi:hypothetical protein
MKTAAAATLLTITMAASAQAATITLLVPGTSDMWLAGMPDGSEASVGPNHTPDVAGTHSPVLVPLTLEGGYIMTFLTTGGVSNYELCCSSIEGEAPLSHVDGAQNGLADVIAPLNTLLGVFLDDTQPDVSPAPSALDFGPTGLGLDFLSLSPGLKQVFFIGDGSTSGGTVQHFVVPAGATRLFLGTMDGYGWYNNTGAFSVEVYHGDITVPEPSTLLLLGTAFATLGLRRSRRLK